MTEQKELKININRVNLGAVTSNNTRLRLIVFSACDGGCNL